MGTKLKREMAFIGGQIPAKLKTRIRALADTAGLKIEFILKSALTDWADAQEMKP